LESRGRHIRETSEDEVTMAQARLITPGWAVTNADSVDGAFPCRIWFFFFFVVDHDHLNFAPAHPNVDNPGRGGDSVRASVMLDGRWAHRMLCSQCNAVRHRERRDMGYALWLWTAHSLRHLSYHGG
jgi:hypothetical protein